MSSLSSPPEGGFFRPRGPPGPPGPPPFPPPAHLKPRWPRPTPPPGNGRFPAPRSSARGAGPRMGGRMPPVGGSPPIRGGGAQRMMQRHPGPGMRGSFRGAPSPRPGIPRPLHHPNAPRPPHSQTQRPPRPPFPPGQRQPGPTSSGPRPPIPPPPPPPSGAGVGGAVSADFLLPWTSDYDRPLPAALTAKCRPLHCDLCSVSMNSSVQADMHYVGKTHDKHARHFLTQWARESGCEPPRRLRGGAEGSETAAKRAKKAAASEEEKNFTAEDLYCKTCDMNFTSALHAEQHYNGRNHGRKAAGLPPLRSGYLNSRTGKWQRHPPGIEGMDARSGLVQDGGTVTLVANMPPPPVVPGSVCPPLPPQQPDWSSDAAPPGIHFPPPPPKSSESAAKRFFCDLCSVAATSQQQLDMHLNGKAHKARREGGFGRGGGAGASPGDAGMFARKSAEQQKPPMQPLLTPPPPPQSVQAQQLPTQPRQPQKSYQSFTLGPAYPVPPHPMSSAPTTASVTNAVPKPSQVQKSNPPQSAPPPPPPPPLQPPASAPPPPPPSQKPPPQQQKPPPTTVATTPSAAIVRNKLTKSEDKRDYSQFRTPSGFFYCPACNLSLNSENQFVQHVESKRHRGKQLQRQHGPAGPSGRGRGRGIKRGAAGGGGGGGPWKRPRMSGPGGSAPC